LSGVQLVEQRLRRFQIERVKAFSEPAVNRSEQIAGLSPLALIALEPRQAHPPCSWYPAGAYRSLLSLVRAELLDLKPIRALQFPLAARQAAMDANPSRSL
jgi:hypothetical protein